MTDQADPATSPATENASEMHCAASGAAQSECKGCGRTFVQKRSWAVFCSPKCRNDFHGDQRRQEVIRKAAPELYEALVMVRNADEDCRRDGLQTISPAARAKIDASLHKAGYREPKPA